MNLGELEIDLENDPQAALLVGLMRAGAADGAYPLGTQVMKINSMPGDRQKDGTLGVITGNLKTPKDILKEGMPPYAYLVLWEGTEADTFLGSRKVIKL